jgi:uncharacterized protein (DUF1330 family)
MSVLMIFCQEAVTDLAGLQAYSQAAGPTLAGRDFQVRVVSDSPETVEGDWRPGRVVVLEFPSREDALAWYHSPEYAEIKKLRFAATRGSAGVLVETFGG